MAVSCVGRVSDNKYMSCPSRMSDGRHFTDYRPSCELDNMLRFDNRISNSTDYRAFLQANAVRIMEQNRQNACAMNCCGVGPGVFSAADDVIGTMVPEQSVWTADGTVMKLKLKDPNGIGTGRQTYSPDYQPLADWYMTSAPSSKQDRASGYFYLNGGGPTA